MAGAPWNRTVVVALVAASALSTSACQHSAGNAAAATSAAPSPSTAAVTTTTGRTTVPDPTSIDPGLQPYIDLATADLATRLGVTKNEITVRSATLETWPDAGLGCPQPGRQYAQTVTDGSKIILVVKGASYAYHAGDSTLPFLCEPSPSDASSSTT